MRPSTALVEERRQYTCHLRRPGPDAFPTNNHGTIFRLDGIDPADPGRVVPPLTGLITSEQLAENIRPLMILQIDVCAGGRNRFRTYDPSLVRRLGPDSERFLMTLRAS